MHEFLARHYLTEKPVSVSIHKDRIASVTEYDCSEDEARQLPYVSPGFFDIQINGYGGIWFCSESLTVDDVVRVTEALVANGITRYFPTLITASFDALHHGFSVLQQACQSNSLVDRCVAGYHLEGPYISPEDGPRGAHPLTHVRAADWEEFSRLQDASGGRIRLVTLAAEVQNAPDFIRRCRDAGVVVALGHMAANTQEIQNAVDAGAQLSTHLGNGAHGVLPRHPNYLWDQLAEERLWASVIADGWHLPDSVLQCVLKCKSAERTILTCDVSGFAGCLPGRYESGDMAVDVLEDGRLVVAGQHQFLAGSGATTGDCIAEMSRSCGIPLSRAVQMATTNPGKLLQEPIPQLEADEIANLSVFQIASPGHKTGNPLFQPVTTYVSGEPHKGMSKKFKPKQVTPKNSK